MRQMLVLAWELDTVAGSVLGRHALPLKPFSSDTLSASGAWSSFRRPAWHLWRGMLCRGRLVPVTHSSAS